MTKSLGWYTMLVGAAAIGAYALLQALLPGTRGSFVNNMISATPASASLHFLLGGIVLIVGALQFHQGLRTSRPIVHRWMGRIYVLGVLIGGLAGLYLSFNSFGGLVTHFGFGMLAVLWLFTTAMAYQHIRAGNVRAHQQWMIRSYALTLGAVTLRIYLGIGVALGLDFEAAYQAISWLAWVPNLVIAEWVFVSRFTASDATARVASAR
jgi:uncharacterized membrane protein